MTNLEEIKQVAVKALLYKIVTEGNLLMGTLTNTGNTTHSAHEILNSAYKAIEIMGYEEKK